MAVDLAPTGLPVEDAVENTEIPKPLYELAEALLSNKHKDNSLLKRLFNKNLDDSRFTDF